MSTAYYLAARYGMKSTIIEQTSIAAAASGKSGGFLAKNWGSGPTVPLHTLSYDLHRELASTLGLSTYREVSTLNVDGTRKGSNVASWLDQKVSSSHMDSDTAQVTSKELVEKMLQAAVDAVGVEVVIGSAVGIQRDAAGKVLGVYVNDQHNLIPADNVIICLGPWSAVALEDWTGLTFPMQGIKSTSLVFHNVERICSEPYACFCAEDKNDCHLELYPRSNGDLYVCGLGGSDYVSGDRLRTGGDCATAEDVHADPKRVHKALNSLQGMSSIFLRQSSAPLQPDITQACMRPCTSDGLPVMGSIPGNEGLYISAGHNCWGILWAPVSGLSMAELVATGACETLNLAAFDPRRYIAEDGEGPEMHKKRGKKKGAVHVGEQW